MKLDNRGWGIGVMIAFIGVFVLFIAVVAILAYRLGVADKPSIINEVETQVRDDGLN